jgi:hypothetical protein
VLFTINYGNINLDFEMTTEQQKELFSKVYVRALSAAAGYKVSEDDPDDDSVDIRVSSSGARGTTRRPVFEAQLKANSRNLMGVGGMHYPLNIKNYDDLRLSDVVTPRILIVVQVPENVAEWLTQGAEQMLLNHHAYWISLRGMPAISASTRTTVILPEENRLTLESLEEIMRKINANETL